ncbi:hypothetical protein AURDEDRAFT_114674 [Auricularia subglabra TFB-10046 SS5]|nr:hypothetical protein AURDEDRAFT_114674 [Auricularia subglabra TFB-10046 SS5]
MASYAAERAGYASEVTNWSWMVTEQYATHKTSTTTSTSQAAIATQEVDSVEATQTASSTETVSTTAASPAPTAVFPTNLATESPASSTDPLAAASTSLSSSLASPSDGAVANTEHSADAGNPDQAERNAEPQYRTQARRRRGGNRLEKQ